MGHWGMLEKVLNIVMPKKCVLSHSGKHTCVLFPGAMGAIPPVTMMSRPFALLCLLWEQIAILLEESLTSMSSLPGSHMGSLSLYPLEALL